MTKEIANNALIRCAIECRTIDYIGLVKLCYGRYNWDLGAALFDILVEIGDEEYQLGHPLINALAVNEKKDSIPGPRFFYWYYKKFNQSTYLRYYSGKKQLLNLLIKECYEYWEGATVESA